MLLGRGHAAHVDGVVVVAEIFVRGSGKLKWALWVVSFSSVVDIVESSGPNGR